MYKNNILTIEKHNVKWSGLSKKMPPIVFSKSFYNPSVKQITLDRTKKRPCILDSLIPNIGIYTFISKFVLYPQVKLIYFKKIIIIMNMKYEIIHHGVVTAHSYSLIVITLCILLSFCFPNETNSKIEIHFVWICIFL